MTESTAAGRNEKPHESSGNHDKGEAPPGPATEGESHDEIRREDPPEESAPEGSTLEGDASAEATPEGGSAGSPESSREPARKLTPAEAFNELTGTLNTVAARVDEMSDFVHACKARLLLPLETYRQEGRLQGIETLLRVHDLLYQNNAMEGGEAVDGKGDGKKDFVATTLEVLESGLGNLGVRLLVPEVGKKADYAVMSAIGTAPAKKFGACSAGKVARVHVCGFEIDVNGRPAVLRKAEVTVYQRQEKGSQKAASVEDEA